MTGFPKLTELGKGRNSGGPDNLLSGCAARTGSEGLLQSPGVNFPRPGGTIESSPALQCRVSITPSSRPGGTLDAHQTSRPSTVPPGRTAFAGENPALKCRATFSRPSGTGRQFPSLAVARLLRATLLLAGWALLQTPTFAGPTNQECYLKIYLKFGTGETLEKKGNLGLAVETYKDAYIILRKMHEKDPKWESALILNRMADAQTQILDLQAKTGMNPNADTFWFPTEGEPVTRYPWKTNISTGTTGPLETPLSDAWTQGSLTTWQENWQRTNPGRHVLAPNPFYISLPFDDIAFPEKARAWMPATWLGRSEKGKAISGCRDRWVEIKNAQGLSCFAQWEAVGPQGNDQADYIFGSKRPNGPGRALGVSPEVARYLHLAGGGITSWRFVEDTEVPMGEWLQSYKGKPLSQPSPWQTEGLTPTNQ